MKWIVLTLSLASVISQNSNSGLTLNTGLINQLINALSANSDSVSALGNSIPTGLENNVSVSMPTAISEMVPSDTESNQFNPMVPNTEFGSTPAAVSEMIPTDTESNQPGSIIPNAEFRSMPTANSEITPSGTESDQLNSNTPDTELGLIPSDGDNLPIETMTGMDNSVPTNIINDQINMPDTDTTLPSLTDSQFNTVTASTDSVDPNSRAVTDTANFNFSSMSYSAVTSDSGSLTASYSILPILLVCASLF